MTKMHESAVEWARLDRSQPVVSITNDRARYIIATFLRNAEASPQVRMELGKCQTDQERFEVVCGALANELERGVQ